MFGAINPFEQTNNANNNPFAEKPFGSTSPFGAQTGSSIFGGTSTGVFGTPASSPIGSTSVFGASSSPAFGSSTPAFGATSSPAFGFGSSTPAFGATSSPSFGGSSSPAFGSSTPAFGTTSSPAFGAASSSPFGGSSAFGQKPAFGGFGSTPTSSLFGSSFSQSQPAFRSNLFGSSNFGAGSQPAFGVSSTPAFGVSSTPAFGVSSTPAFGTTSTPAFGNTWSAFGVSNSPFGSSTPGFGVSSTPAFGTTSTPAFGNTRSAFGVSNSPFRSSTPAFGVSSTPAFGVSSTPAFGVSAAPAFGTTSAPAFSSSPTTPFGASGPAFSFASCPAFGQSTSAFCSSQFAAQSSPFDAGAQATTPAFGTPNFGQPSFGTQQRAVSRATPYAQTPEADGGTGTQPAGKLESISAMPAYKEKSHEELRWEDYQAGDKGGPNPAGQSSGGMGFNTNNTQSNPFSSSPSFTQPAANPFSSTPSSTNPFAQKTSTFSTPGFAGSTPTLNSSPFATPTNPFASTPAQTPSVFNTTSSNPFGTQTTPSLFGTPNTSSAFGTSTSIFGTTPAQGTTPSFGTGMNFGTQSANLFQSSSPALPQTSSPFGQTGSAFSAPAFGQTGSAFGQPNAFSGNMFSSTPSLQNTSNLTFNQTPSSVPFQSTQPTQNSGFGFGAPAGGIGGTSSIFGQNNNFGQMPTNQSPAVAQPQSITNPFGTLPAMPQMSIGRVGNAPSIQYGISSLPVVDKPAPMRISSVLTSRHLSQSRIRLPARKYHPKNDSPKVSFFSDEEETTSTPKADALFIPRENPRALVIRPLETWPGKASAEKPKGVSSSAQTNGEYTEFASTSHLNGRPTDNGNGNHSENGFFKEQSSPVKITQKTNGLHEDQSTPKSDSYISLTGHRAGEAAIVYEHGADIEALMPKLRHSDYYTEPRIQELAAKERAEPGFCRRVKDFIVGRHNYGSIKFLGETDVRRLDLESLIQFNHREVIVYMDETKKPPVGQGLNKPAEVTLLNIKCSDKKTGSHFTEGPRVEKYKEMLKKKAEDQGAEFVSYDPIKGEWKFRVSHFSQYGLEDDEDMGLAE